MDAIVCNLLHISVNNALIALWLFYQYQWIMSFLKVPLLQLNYNKFLKSQNFNP